MRRMSARKLTNRYPATIASLLTFNGRASISFLSTANTSQTMSLHREGTSHSSPAKLPRNAGRTRHRSQSVDRHPPRRIPVGEGGPALPGGNRPGDPIRLRPLVLLHRSGRCGTRPRRVSRPHAAAYRSTRISSGDW